MQIAMTTAAGERSTKRKRDCVMPSSVTVNTAGKHTGVMNSWRMCAGVADATTIMTGIVIMTAISTEK